MGHRGEIINWEKQNEGREIMMNTNDKIERPKRKTFCGTVISDGMDKTRIIRVVRTIRHSFYEKALRKESRFYAHDESNKSRVGDTVEIIGTMPLSKLKRWRITKILSKVK